MHPDEQRQSRQAAHGSPDGEIPAQDRRALGAEEAAVLESALTPARIPRATYRIQLNADFPFAAAQAIVPYLDELGVSDLYVSPIVTARPGSAHGYDVVDPGSVNPALGGEQGLDMVVDALRERGMGLLLDTVPNHMGIGDPQNVWWMDVLENGRSSAFVDFFDVEWRPVKPELEDKVLLPILGDQYGRVLENGELKLSFEDGAFFIRYYEHLLPVAPGTYSRILAYPLEDLEGATDLDQEHLQEYQSILTAIGYLPRRTETDPERVAERSREKEVIKRRLAALYQDSPIVRAALDVAVQVFNGTPGDPRSFDRLDELIDAQAYRPAFWRVAGEEINYRRFFDINDLAAIRTEDPAVFAATHRMVFRLLAEGKATGLRIDHIDGLYDPAGYLRRLQETYVFHRARALLGQSRTEPVDDDELAAEVAARMAPLFEARAGTTPWPLYVVAEKILAEGEPLPAEWAVHGTTGYEFLNLAGGLFVDRRSAAEFDAIYGELGGSRSYRELINTNKEMTMLVAMASEIYTLSHRLERISEKNRRYRDFTLDTMTFALRAVIASLAVYRTYITDAETVSSRDRQFIERAIGAARRRNPRTAREVFDFIRDTLILRNLENFRPDDRPLLLTWVRRFQQLTGPVMAKGVEDTTFYVYNRLVSLNEVGGHPEHFGTSVAAFHKHNAEMQARLPHTMLTTSTHDTKRSEDVRARIDVLSELPSEWRDALRRWLALNARFSTMADDQRMPDVNDEYLLYQTLIGTWPFELLDDGAWSARSEDWAVFVERVAAYMAKATKEAKVNTSWVNPNQAYDEAVQGMVRQMLDPAGGVPFLRDIAAFSRRVAFFGRFNSLSQTLLKLTAPGVPDIYQGCELWDLSLVDPDNRRPVDYDVRRRMLARLKSRAEAAGDDRRALVGDLLATSDDGAIKLYLTHGALELRRGHPDLFERGEYRPLQASGARAEHAVAFARTYGADAVVTVVPRLVASLIGGVELMPIGEGIWSDTWLVLPEEEGRVYRNRLTGELLTVEARGGQAGLSVADVLGLAPVALLERLSS